jgi:hypothetical protein
MHIDDLPSIAGDRIATFLAGHLATAPAAVRYVFETILRADDARLQSIVHRQPADDGAASAPAAIPSLEAAVDQVAGELRMDRKALHGAVRAFLTGWVWRYLEIARIDRLVEASGDLQQLLSEFMVLLLGHDYVGSEDGATREIGVADLVVVPRAAAARAAESRRRASRINQAVRWARENLGDYPSKNAAAAAAAQRFEVNFDSVRRKLR